MCRWWVLLGEGKPMDFKVKKVNHDEVLKVERGVFCSKKNLRWKKLGNSSQFQAQFFQH